MVTNAQYPEHQRSLLPGDIVILCSDGIVEAMNGSGEMYGFERFLARVQDAPAASAREMVSWALAGVQDFVGSAEQHDDMTLVIIIAGAGKTNTDGSSIATRPILEAANN